MRAPHTKRRSAMTRSPRARACPQCRRNNALKKDEDRDAKITTITCVYCSFTESKGRNA